MDNTINDEDVVSTTFTLSSSHLAVTHILINDWILIIVYHPPKILLILSTQNIE